MRLNNKIGLVTAAGSGMGRAGALIFAREGARVAVVDRDADAANAVVEEIKANGGEAIALAGDLRSDEFAGDIVDKTVEHFGALDFVWNHIGIPGPGAVEGIDMDDFALAVDLNIRSVLVTTVRAVPHLRGRKGAALLYTGSTSGVQASAYSPVYTSLKHGVVGLAKGVAKRYAKDGIRANVVCPGPIDTPMLREFVNRPDSGGDASKTEDLVKERSQATPLGRAGQPEEIANAALFLISDEASFITGATLLVDGGISA